MATTAAHRIQPAEVPQRVLITQVNPFEDVPGYQYAKLLGGDESFALHLCDDSQVAVDVLTDAGYSLSHLPHPYTAAETFRDRFFDLLRSFDPAVVVPGSDSHLFAIARLTREHPGIVTRCRTANWLAERALFDKWDLQDFAARWLPTPQRWRGLNVDEAAAVLAARGKLVAKGLVKEARVITEAPELEVWTRELLRNPANQGAHGGVYFEEVLEGPEYCRLIVRGRQRAQVVDLRKIAATRSGTTMVGEIIGYGTGALDTSRLEAELESGMAVEVEWRETADGPLVFEVNPRFPSWVGALGTYGEMLLRSSIAEQAEQRRIIRAPRPAAGTRIVRLPHFGPFGDAPRQRGGRWQPLWNVAAPHQFIVK